MINSLTYTTHSYSAQKKRNINKFYNILSAYPTLSDLAKTQADPKQDNEQNLVTQFVLLTRGVKTAQKNAL